MEKMFEIKNEVDLWECVMAYQNAQFFTMKGLPFKYVVKQGRNGPTKELIVDRRKDSKTLSWSSLRLAFQNIPQGIAERPKALGDIRGISYIYSMFYRFGLIEVPDAVAQTMNGK